MLPIKACAHFCYHGNRIAVPRFIATQLDSNFVMNDPAADAIPKRAVSSRGRRKGATGTDGTLTGEELPDDRLNIRVKDRVDDSAINRKSRIGGIFKETPISGLLKESPAEKLKRPLTGMSNLFRRPGSRAGRPKDEEAPSSQRETLFDRGGSPLPPRNPSPTFARRDVDLASHAPHIASTQLQGFLQDNVTSRRPYLATLDHIDVSLLSRFLCTEDEVQDESVAWNWDYLFTSLSNEMREEWAQENRLQ